MMKKFNFLIALGLSVFALQAHYSLSWDGAALGDTVTIQGDPADEEMIFNAILTNNGDDADTIKITRRRIYQLENTIHYFCWGACFSPNNPDSVFMPEAFLVIEAGASSDEFAFVAHYTPNDEVGTSMFEYTFYNKNDRDEKVVVVAKFVTTPDGVLDQLMANAHISDLYPNPATSYVSINYDLPAQVETASVKIMNILGSVVKNEVMNKNASNLRVDVSDLTNGVYFYSVIINNEVYKTKKLVVK